MPVVDWAAATALEVTSFVQRPSRQSCRKIMNAGFTVWCFSPAALPRRFGSLDAGWQYRFRRPVGSVPVWFGGTEGTQCRRCHREASADGMAGGSAQFNHLKLGMLPWAPIQECRSKWKAPAVWREDDWSQYRGDDQGSDTVTK